MNLERFTRQRQDAWRELEDLVARAGRRPERLGAERVRRLARLYRSAAADLALARRLFPGDPVVVRLESVVGRARHLVYGAGARRPAVVQFLVRDYWRFVAEKPAALAAAAALLFAPAALAGTWAIRDAPAAAGLVPAEFRAVTESDRPWEHVPADEQAAFSSAVMTNNIRVTATAFAGGMAFGLLTGFVLVFNGILLGAVAGLLVEAGNWRTFVELVTAHGVLELSCIVVAGAAGLRLGWSIVEPGRRTRRESVVHEARRSIGLVLGTAPWLVLAGIVEGFRATWSDLGLGAVLGVGFGLGVLYWGLVWTLGRREPVTVARGTSPAGTR